MAHHLPALSLPIYFVMKPKRSACIESMPLILAKPLYAIKKTPSYCVDDTSKHTGFHSWTTTTIYHFQYENQ